MQNKLFAQASMPSRPTDSYWMRQALVHAHSAALQGEVPVGAIIVREEKLIATAHNNPIQACDPTAHAEINVMRQAAKTLGNYRLLGTTLYVTLEPCLMCLSAMMHARVERLVVGAHDTKKNTLSVLEQYANVFNHTITLTTGVCEPECGQILKVFFEKKRTKKPIEGLND